MIDKLLESFIKKIARQKHTISVEEFIEKHKKVSYKSFSGEPKLVLNESIGQSMMATFIFLTIGMFLTLHRDLYSLGIFFLCMSIPMSWGIFFPPQIVLYRDSISYRNSTFLSVLARIKRAKTMPYSRVKSIQFVINEFNNSPLVYVVFIMDNGLRHLACFTNFDKCLLLSSFFPKEGQSIENNYS